MTKISGLTEDATVLGVDWVATEVNAGDAAKKTALKDLPGPEVITIPIGDEVTAITTGTTKITYRLPFAFTLNAGNDGVRGMLTTASSSGIPTVDINLTGTGTILSTKLTIDANETTSLTAATAVVLSTTVLADDAELTFDIDVAGTGAAGLKVALIGYRT